MTRKSVTVLEDLKKIGRTELKGNIGPIKVLFIETLVWFGFFV